MNLPSVILHIKLYLATIQKAAFLLWICFVKKKKNWWLWYLAKWKDSSVTPSWRSCHSLQCQRWRIPEKATELGDLWVHPHHVPALGTGVSSCRWARVSPQSVFVGQQWRAMCCDANWQLSWGPDWLSHLFSKLLGGYCQQLPTHHSQFHGQQL